MDYVWKDLDKIGNNKQPDYTLVERYIYLISGKIILIMMSLVAQIDYNNPISC